MNNLSSRSESYLYEQVVEKMTGLIGQGVLRPGDRIPSVRRLSLQMHVSISTVLQAYLLLESRGLIEARPQSGYYVKVRAEKIPPEPRTSTPYASATPVGVGELVSKVLQAASHPEIVPLGAGVPSPDLLPVRQLNHVMAAIGRRRGAAAIGYDFPPGNEGLRRQIARRSLDWGCHLSTDEIVTTCGGMEALNLCLRAVANPGDTIVIESPTFFGVLQVIESLKMKALEIATHPRDGIDLEALERAVKRNKVRACILIPNFNNPLGSCMPEKNKKSLVEILARREIPLIEDDIYGDLYFGVTRPKTVKAFDKHGLVLLCSSFSKNLAPGYRVGWTAPGRFKFKVEQLKFMNTLATASLPQMTIAQFLDSGGYDRHLRRLRKSLATQVQRISLAISRYFPEGTRVTRPSGGFVLWVELPKSVNSLELHRKALREKISIIPGCLFSAKKRYQNFIRLSCGHPWSDRLEQALITLGRLAGKD
ncbi:MAG TPA: PLP-dependent aminotransferase family protein [Candidatus Eisenbacteria bacterium]|nr:PLP-dependent aminotransferase family protein [Candidatus Eisenbacteria bacterium]